jgi:hypothetical protein
MKTRQIKKVFNHIAIYPKTFIQFREMKDDFRMGGKSDDVFLLFLLNKIKNRKGGIPTLPKSVLEELHGL